MTLLAATVSVALLGNAFICGVISGPLDRYGARLAWLATFTLLVAVAKVFATDGDQGYGLRDRNSSTPVL